MRAWTALCLVVLMLVACQSPEESTPTAVWVSQATATLAPVSAPVGQESPAPTEALPPASSPTPTQALAPAPAPSQASPTPTQGPAIRLVPPHSPAPTSMSISDSGCGSGPPPSSLDSFPSQSTTVYDGTTYYLVGRDLVVNFQLVDSVGTTAGAELVSIQAQSCTINFSLRYDWIYTQHYAARCPQSLADFDEPASGPWGAYVVGRAFYQDGRLVESEGQLAGDPSEEAGECQGRSFRYVVYWCYSPSCVPEASTLVLMGSAITALAGWVAWRRKARGGI
jgi:hypothetical protein